MATSKLLTGVETPPALSTVIADRLREMITSGVLAPGERLKEVELADSMAVSRGPVREAISELVREGLVESQRHRGARVITLDDADIEEIYSMRLAIERLAMERCAERISPSALDAMDDVIGRMARVPADAHDNEHVSLDLEFHDLVYAAADHARLQRTWTTLRSQVSMFLNARTDRADFRTKLHVEHQEMRDVLATGDPVAAVGSIEKHIGWTLRQLRKMRDLAHDPAETPPLSGPGPEGKTGL
ncbi:GntR family transcriptional regulator [Brachybacterium saurashtrense]|uniref:GntR family transcriptional regulator n=1 Tax=Brachybacterium saurashtrense TaxID=556288 RepID=A0A345YJT1_9MICO|nr:GntR family transcriptional regulator [Brachybacterium saurashtrense]AXK44183.1 GntR family transcriptional regulator [Brachybacterium saurashtrense]RRR21455.1 GntR family transcriptional regulator [Brachybacterium saurashtrense]